jgi:hypothetical protein
LRNFLLKNQLQQIVDFGDLQVFDEATTYPCIVHASKANSLNCINAVEVKTLKFDKGFNDYIKANCQKINTENFGTETWVISSTAEHALVSKLKANFVSLYDYVGGKANYGIKTSLSEAFIIDEETKDRLIAEDINSTKLIRPFLLGRNVKPYTVPVVSHYLILIPKGFTIKRNLEPGNPNYISEPMPRYGFMHINVAWDWFKTNYPAIANYLLPFKEKAEARTDQGDFWWELRACDYYGEFQKPKIMYQKFQVKPCFIFDESEVYCNDSMWIIPTDDKVLLAILNSKMGWWLISKYCTAIQNGYQLIWKYFGQIPIPAIANGQMEIIDLVDKIMVEKRFNQNTTALETKIDKLVYRLYGLTEEEIKIVDSD